MPAVAIAGYDPRWPRQLCRTRDERRPAAPAPPPSRAYPILPSARSSAAISSPPSRSRPSAPRTKATPKAMTLLAELYANGLGVPQDDKKAAEWYKLAAARGDPNAMFALAMFDLQRPRRPARPRGQRQMACGRGQARPPAGRLRSRAALHRRTIVPAGFHPRRRTAAHRGPGRQPRCAICARHVLQRGPRRAEGHARGGAAVGASHARRQYRRARSNTPSRSITATASPTNEAAAAHFSAKPRKRQRHRAGPARPHPRQRPGRAGRPGPGDEVAPHFDSRRRDQSRTRRFRRQAARRQTQCRREGGKTVARSDESGAAGAAIAADRADRAGEAVIKPCSLD